MVRRVAWTKLRRPNRPAVGAPAWIARRTPPLRQSMSSPAWVTVSSVGSGALGSLKVRKWNVSPASSDASTWRKSWSELLKCANGMYSRPVMGSTTGLVNWSEFCACAGFGSADGAKMVFVTQVAPPSVERPKRSCWPVDWKLVQRSEEHTSELQSRLHLVCRLLLEKKKIAARVIPREPLGCR